MTVKPDAQEWRVKEQIIEDAVTGLTLQFALMPNGTPRLRLYGNLPFGNREIIFNAAGEEAGSGTALTGLCRPSWLRDVG